ncbi:MAG: DUF1957 domain-containing protein, partial [Chitinispirillaceae bacterium]|nr:DUF1957 domain-containing protein [Chitinispirillaceae bacterium]
SAYAEDGIVQKAVRRIKEHIANFLRLYEDLNKNNINENFLSLLESHNNIFPNIDYSVYAVELEHEK